MEELTPIITLRERAECTLETVNTYLATFNGDGILILFESNTDRKKYLERYSAFALKLNSILSTLEGDIAAISRLIAEYEDTRSQEETKKLCSLFKYCEDFLAFSAKFICDNEENFKHRDAFNPAHTLKSARELKVAAEIFKEKING